MTKQLEILDGDGQASLAKQETTQLAVLPGVSDPIGLLQLALEKGHSPESIGVLATAMADLKMKMDDRAARQEFNQAVLAFKEEVPAVVKARRPTQGPQYDYAAIEDIEQVITPALVKHGLSYRFPESIGTAAGKMRTTIRVSHVAGHFEDTSVELPIPDMRVNETQRAAAAISYGRRYCLCSALGLRLVGHDNDAAELQPTSEATRAAMEPVTIEQANELNRLGAELGLKKPDWLEWAGKQAGRKIGEWIDLPQSLYENVIGAMRELQRKRDTRGAVK